MNLSPVSPDQSTGTWPAQHVTWPLDDKVSTFEKVFGHILQLNLDKESCDQALQSLSYLDQLHIRSFADTVAHTCDQILESGVAAASATMRSSTAGGVLVSRVRDDMNSACSELDGQSEHIDTELAYSSQLSSPPNSTHDGEYTGMSFINGPVPSPDHQDNEEEQVDEEPAHTSAVPSPDHQDNEEEQVDVEPAHTSAAPSLDHQDNEEEQVGEEPAHGVGDFTAQVMDSIEQFESSIDPESDKFSLCQTLLSQTASQFAHESYLQIQRMSLSESSETCQGLLEALQSLPENDCAWSDGSRWATIIEVGDNDYRVASIRTAVRFAAYARWHMSQASYLQHTQGMKEIQASQSVFERVLGHKPQKSGLEQSEWQRRRQRLSTCYTRGKKWLRLLDAFGSGILFKDAWALVKLREEDLSKLIREGTNQSQKMEVLRLLTAQLETLSILGRTDPEEFQKQLTNLGYDDPRVQFTTTNDEKVDDFIKEVRRSATSDKLSIPHANFQFDPAALNRLGPQKWFNDDLLLACLHLSTKMPSLRIGFSVPIHRQTVTRGGSVLPDPFQMASILISESRDKQSCTDRSLVWLFPLFQHNNHFSLLEINEGDKRIYHYDSMNEGENYDIKNACEERWPGFEYVEQDVVQQHDLHSCGPLVIMNARNRMMGLCIAKSSTRHDPIELRSEALNILQSAWKDGALIFAPKENTNKKRRCTRNATGGVDKRRKSR